MADEGQKVTLTDSAVAPKRTYNAPKLEEYGTLAGLTAGEGIRGPDTPYGGSQYS